MLALIVGITSRRVNFISDADVASFLTQSAKTGWCDLWRSAHYPPDPEVIEGWCPRERGCHGQ